MKINRVSVCITIFNEKEETVKNLLSSLNSQTLRPDEIIVIDAKDYNNCSRSKGRNIAIKKARNKIIAITDAGCIPHKNWLEKITKPFTDNKVDVVAGGYKMVYKNSFEKAESVFLGVKERDMDSDFMPSARSMAFTKNIWKKARGFPESLNDTAEDTLFNLNLVRLNAKFKVAKDAIVDWQMPETILEFAKKIRNYAKGDAKSGIWWHPIKKWKTHNIKILTIYLRYILFLIFPWLIIFYLIFAFNKAGLWGIILQVISDFSVMLGFVSGILKLKPVTLHLMK
jgi:cellulose synthase/poly-beta-1,6-N-acetylglucosamine synthase-like glycosyltransferase